MLEALNWYIAIQALGILALPAAFVLFRRLPDRGFTLAKPAAMVFFSYVLWVLGLSHIAPNTRLTIILILVVAAVPSAFLLRRFLAEIKDFVRQNWPMLVAAELLFIGFFLMWLGIVSEVPAINHTEKPMDFGFMNAVLQSRFFPPEDPWLSGNPISYYYFGHFMMAFLTQLTGVASSVGYNLGVSLLPGLVAMGAFGLVYNLVRLSGGSLKAGIVFGGAAPALVLLAGNLEGAMEFVHLQGWAGAGFWEWAGIKGLTGAETGSGVFPDGPWWWFRASRVIDTLSGGQSLDYTITEFPIFSFILGDLHPHVMNLPFVILGLGLCLNLFQSTERLGLRWLRDNPVESAAIALFIGSLAFINIWDLPVMAAMLGASALVKAYGDHGGDLTGAALGAAGVRVMSMDLFLPHDDTPVVWDDLDGSAQASFVWRGAMDASAVREFLSDTVWGELELLLIDLPPGAHSFPTVAQLVPDLDGAIVVTIPSDASRLVVKKSITLAKEAETPLLGLVENMAGYHCAHCGVVGELFPAAEGRTVAEELGVPSLGRVPFDPRLARSAEGGRLPFVLEHGDSPAGKALNAIADRVEQLLGG